MTFYVHQFFLLGVLCISLVLASGFDTSLDFEGQTIEPAKRPNCLIGRPGPPQTCCIEECTPNCRKDCTAKGFSAGGCYTALGANFCCCIV
ncbi:LCR [Medicago truncatula]|uniref:LCR n=1 Tax=Medicago truncatula TaxID=3880 RepID=A0A072UTF5_MEDTR|nr:LCR [Medicago truncatula]